MYDDMREWREHYLDAEREAAQRVQRLRRGTLWQRLVMRWLAEREVAEARSQRLLIEEQMKRAKATHHHTGDE